MRMYQVYVCDKCGKESRKQEEIELCEAGHIGLHTLEDKHAYDSIKSFVQYCGSVVSTTKNEKTEKAYDEAIERLLEFERQHNMTV